MEEWIVVDKADLIELAEDAGVEIDKRWGEAKIIAALADAGVAVAEEPAEDLVVPVAPKAPAAKKVTDSLKTAPVRFQAKTGRIRIRDGRDEITNFGRTRIAGLVVDFTPTGRPDSIPAGGLSREFYPEKDEHESENEQCDCKHCLAEVREWIKKDRMGIATAAQVMEAMLDTPAIPMPGWDTVSVADLDTLIRTGALNPGTAGDAVVNAIKYESLIGKKRDAIIEHLEAVHAADEDDDALDSDVLDAEVSL